MTSDRPEISAEVRECRERFRQAIAECAALNWSALVARALETRENWDHAAAELTDEDAPVGPRSADPWGPYQVMSHLGGYLTHMAETLEGMLQGQDGAVPGDAQWLGNNLDFPAVRSQTIQAWDRFITAVMLAPTANGAAGFLQLAVMDGAGPKEAVGYAIWHANSHADQMRTLRGLAADQNPGDAAGDLGRRRQTAH